MTEKIIVGLTSAAAAGLLAWTGTALTLTGRVAAIEQSLLRIEARMDAREATKHAER